MKRKMLATLIAAITAGSILCLSGCGIDLTTVGQKGTTLSAEMEAEDLFDGSVQIHSTWYNEANAPLVSSTISFDNGKKEVASGTTNEYGIMDAVIVPGNDELTCTVTDATGQVIAQTNLVFKISNNYPALTIYPMHGEEDTLTLEIPSNKTDVRAAIFVTENGTISISNLSPYIASDIPEEVVTDEAAEGTEEAAPEAAAEETAETTTEATE